jgi:methionine synthase I (cobalamin-dependent)
MQNPEQKHSMEAPGLRRRPLARRLAEGEILVADGAMGTLLMAQGLESGASPEAWNVEHPDRIIAVHRAYAQAGSQIVLTNTFGGSRIRLARTGNGERVAELNRAGAALAREAAGDRAYVAGDIGPSGEMMQPLGSVSFADAADNFSRQAEALAAGGVDALWVETMTDLEEARAAVTGARRATDLPVLCSLSFGPGGRTMMGVSVAQALDALLPLGVAAIGANCGEGLDVMDVVLGQMQALAPGIPMIAKPNAGLPRFAGGETIYDVGPDQFAERIGAFIRHGARVVGACCGSNPAYIAAIVQAIKGLSVNRIGSAE